jgi:hypothetical protein
MTQWGISGGQGVGNGLGQLTQLIIAIEFVPFTQLPSMLVGKGTPQRATHWLYSDATVQSKSDMQGAEPYFSISCCRDISYSLMPTSHDLASGTHDPQHWLGWSS